MVKAIVFDFDDTLIHTYEAGLKNLETILNKLNLPLPSISSLKEHYGKSMNDLLDNICPGTTIEEFTKTCSMLDNKLVPYPAIKGVHSMIDILSSKYILGIVTGGNKQHFMEKIIKAGIDIKKFSFILTQDEIQKSKNDPTYFDSALTELSKLGIGKHDTIFVGDSKYDKEISENAGIHFVGVLTGPTTKQELISEGIKENMIIPSVMELPYLIQNNGFSGKQ